MNWFAPLILLFGPWMIVSQAALVSKDGDRQSCSMTYRKSNGFLYCAEAFNAGSPTWQEATDFCKNVFGGNLPVILSAQDNADVAKLRVLRVFSLSCLFRYQISSLI